MALSYLMNQPWTSWSREERLFCAVLYEHGRRNPHDFARWLIEATSLDVSADGDWDLGYEVCLYRDFLWQKGGLSAVGLELPPKRTFDLCLFGERALVVIEAKVCQPFDSVQNADFEADRQRISHLDGMQDLQVKLVALASARYLANVVKFSPRALDEFDGQLSWAQAAQRFHDPLLDQADSMYKGKPGDLLVG